MILTGLQAKSFLRVDGKTALVTGGARGLGRAIAQRLAELGAAGAIVDLRSELPQASVPDGWKRVAADVRREEEIAAAVVATLDGLGRLDIVVANAGVVPPWRETEALDLAEWDDVFAINVRGVAATLKHTVPALKARGGAIIVTASLNSWRAHPHQSRSSFTRRSAGTTAATPRNTVPGRSAPRPTAPRRPKTRLRNPMQPDAGLHSARA